MIYYLILSVVKVGIKDFWQYDILSVLEREREREGNEKAKRKKNRHMQMCRAYVFV